MRQPLDMRARIQLAEDLIKPGRAAEHGRFAGDYPRLCFCSRGDEDSRDITAADILRQRGAHSSLNDLGGRQLHDELAVIVL